ncbi:MAG: C39 family peptidase [Planctomycetes bacterium]|nr:C39 family peptidase [Planctomycetota bacterium]
MLEEIRALAEAGAYRAAWQRLAPVDAAEATLLELRHHVAHRLGLDTQRRLALRRLRRLAPDRLRTHALQLFEEVRTNRLLAGWERWRRGDQPAPRDAAEEQLWHLAVARLQGHLRDFERARESLERAAGADADPRLLELERAWVLLDQDLRDEAIACCRGALSRWPRHGLLLEQECWLLDGSGKPEAVELFERRRHELESPLIEGSLAFRRFELGELDRARSLAERVLATGPTGRSLERMLQALLLRIARSEGDDERALRHAHAVRPPIKPWAEKLAAPRDPAYAERPSRVLRAVPFVKQDHLTCSPATMASLLRFFGLDIEQREIAEKITYDGTPVHSEWVWAEERGLESAFFLFEPELARELIDLGLPFAISLRGETWGHRVALCGYDRLLDTFLLRDPNHPLLQEMQTEFLQTYVQRRGGICTLHVPRALATRFPARLREQAALWLDYVKMLHAFEERRLPEAESLAEGLLRRADGVLARFTRGKMAEERRDERALVELTREELAEHPDDVVLQANHVRALDRAGRWDEHRAFLERVSAPLEASPVLRLWYADAIRQNAAERRRAERIVRSALRQMPTDAHAYRGLADILWEDRSRRAEATELYRVAACLAPHEEGLARSHALACILLGEEQRGLEWLRRRVETFGAKSPEPTLTLVRLLEDFDKPEEALALLRENAAQHPTKPAAQRALFGKLLDEGLLDEATAQFERLAPILGPVARELAAAQLARARGDFGTVLAALERATSYEPPSAQAFATYWNELFVQRGTDAARATIEALVEKHGDDPRLMTEALEFYRRIEDREREGALLRRLVREHPHEPWLREKLAQHLFVVGALDELEGELAALELALPDSPRVCMLRARFLAARGDKAAAFATARKGLELREDLVPLLRLSLELAPDPDAADAVLRESLSRWLEAPRPPHQEALQLWLEHTQPHFDEEEIARGLAALRETFPGAREIRLAVAEQRLEKAPREALAEAEALALDLPGDTAAQLLRLRCLRKAQRYDEARAGLEQLLQQKPTSVDAHTLLGQCLEDQAELGAAREAYRRGIGRVPSSSILQGYLADVCWKLDLNDEALAAVARAHELDRDYSWAWNAHVIWLTILERQEEALAIAEDCARTNPRWALAHQLLARAYRALGRNEEQIAALRTALEIQPRLGAERTRLLDSLIANQRYEEARAVAETGRKLLGDDEGLASTEARILRAQGELAASRAELRAALARHPEGESLWMLHLQWLEQEELFDEILATIAAAPPAIAELPALHAYAADARKQKGELDAAIAALRRALELAPDYHWARDRLAELCLEKGAYAEVPALLGENPSALPLPRASLVGRAAVELRRRELAQACFDRLLGAIDVEPAALRALDEALRKLDPIAQNRRLRELAQSGALAPRANALFLLGERRDRSRFLSGLTRLWRELPREHAERIVSRLCEDAARSIGRKVISRWIAEHLQQPVDDEPSLGRFAFALSHAEGYRAMIRLFGKRWKRPGVESWMLANLSAAWLGLDMLEQAEKVSTYAVESLPRDHGIWWHQRTLAEIALRRGAPSRCLEILREPPASFAAELLRSRVLELRARLALTRSWLARRRLLAEQLPRLRAARPAARREGVEREDSGGWAIFRACPCWASLRYALS